MKEERVEGERGLDRMMMAFRKSRDGGRASSEKKIRRAHALHADSSGRRQQAVLEWRYKERKVGGKPKKARSLFQAERQGEQSTPTAVSWVCSRHTAARGGVPFL
eukprot:scaffold238778_cov26-Tisochrysis_lutea.AAC.1